MPKLSEIYGGNYLKADDIKDRGDVNVVIENVSIMDADDGKKKAVLHFKGKDKTLVLNVTNANMVDELLGSDDTDEWIGRRICLYTTKVDFQGKRVLAIRVKAARVEAAKGRAVKPPPEPEPETDPDIPDEALEEPPF
jgi:hypothetical protein